MTILTVVYGFISTVTLVSRSYFFFQAAQSDMPCASVVAGQPEWMVWGTTIYYFVDLSLPIWLLIWYFNVTVRPSYSISVIPASMGNESETFQVDNFPATPARLEINATVASPSTPSASTPAMARTPSYRKFAPYSSAPSSAASSFSEVSQFLQGDDFEEGAQWGTSRPLRPGEGDGDGDGEDSYAGTSYSPEGAPIRTITRPPPPNFSDA